MDNQGGLMGRFKSVSLLAAALLLAAFSTSGVSNSKTLCEGFVPANDMRIPVGDRSHLGLRNNGGLTEAQYNSIMDRIQSMFQDVVKQRGGNLVINRLWTDDTVNSSAEQQGSSWIINMYGGIARHPDVTIEGEALIACHEMGHHLGGAPKEAAMGAPWATDEGGADYFATLKCLKTFFAADDNASVLSHATVDPLAQSQCKAQFSAKVDQDICQRISLSGESVSYLFQDLGKEATRPQFGTPDTTQVSQTNDDHPATQCRMDTYFAGGLCQIAASVPNSDTDFKAGSCVQGVDKIGFRPRCWFNPDSNGGGGGGGGGGGTCPLGDQSQCDQLCKIMPTLPFCKQ
jgi:hypothetical protein